MEDGTVGNSPSRLFGHQWDSEGIEPHKWNWVKKQAYTDE